MVNLSRTWYNKAEGKIIPLLKQIFQKENHLFQCIYKERKDVFFMCNNANKLESLLASSKLSDMLAESKLGELIKKKEDPIEEKKHTLIFVLAIIGAIAAVAAIAYAVYRYVTPDYMDDFDDDFDDDDELEDDLDFDATEETEKEPETKTDENEEE